MSESAQLDYTPEVLSKKKFSELQNEDFDHDPQRPTNALAQIFSNDFVNASLTDRLILAHEANNVEAQTSFFHSLKSDEWEEAGDWFLERFTELMQRAKDARKEKRALANKFEEEVADRVEVVEGTINGTAKTMEEMKKSGQQVVTQATLQGRPEHNEW